MPTVNGQSDDPVQAGVVGTPMKFDVPGPDAIGVLGEGGAGFQLVVQGAPVAFRRAIGVMGTSASQIGAGVLGENTNGGTGVEGRSHGVNAGVFGTNVSGIGVHGECTGSSPGVFGQSDTGIGVQGTSRTNHAVHGESVAGRGVVGISQTFVGVTGTSTSADGVFGNSATGIGVHGTGGKLAGFFEGDVEITGDIRLLNADCAEDFDISPSEFVEPGSVMVLGDSDGALYVSRRPYDKRVAGVVSGAGNYKPGIVLDKQNSQNDRRPIALLGKVYCKVDASYSQIEVGDLLTTSPNTGHAMKATDPSQAFGAVIGKALRPLTEGQGLIPILIALQ